jgi:thiol-disulfide isomerase/thioredoxin
MRRFLGVVGILAVLSALGGAAAAGDVPVEARRRGIVGQEAPTWSGIESWHQLPKGKTALDVSEFRGKVVYLYFFQSWCPGCHSRGFPTLAATRSAFAARDDVVFLAVQTVFEGFWTNTAEKGLETLKKFALDIPMGHDPGPGGSGSRLMKRYRSGGTPWTVIIDKSGVVRFDGFRLTPTQARSLVGRLVAGRASKIK